VSCLAFKADPIYNPRPEAASLRLQVDTPVEVFQAVPAYDLMALTEDTVAAIIAKNFIVFVY